MGGLGFNCCVFGWGSIVHGILSCPSSALSEFLHSVPSSHEEISRVSTTRSHKARPAPGPHPPLPLEMDLLPTEEELRASV